MLRRTFFRYSPALALLLLLTAGAASRGAASDEFRVEGAGLAKAAQLSALQVQ